MILALKSTFSSPFHVLYTHEKDNNKTYQNLQLSDLLKRAILSPEEKMDGVQVGGSLDRNSFLKIRYPTTS